jgi:hypothetical protein
MGSVGKKRKASSGPASSGPARSGQSQGATAAGGRASSSTGDASRGGRRGGTLGKETAQALAKLDLERKKVLLVNKWAAGLQYILDLVDVLCMLKLV